MLPKAILRGLSSSTVKVAHVGAVPAPAVVPLIPLGQPSLLSTLWNGASPESLHSQALNSFSPPPFTLREENNDIVYTVPLPGFAAKNVTCELAGAEFSILASLQHSHAKGGDSQLFKLAFPVGVDLALDPHVKLNNGQL